MAASMAWVIGCGGPAPTPPPDAPCTPLFVDRQWGGALDDELLGLAADAEGAVYVAGYVDGVLGLENDGPVGDATGFVRQLLRHGSGWTYALDTATTDVVDAVVMDGDALVFAGRSRGAIPGASNQGAFDLVLGRLDPSGAAVWLGQHGLGPPEQPRRVAVDAMGRVVVAGFRDIYVPTNFVEAWENPFVAAFPEPAQGTSGALAPAWFVAWDTMASDFVFGAALEGAGAVVTGATADGPDRGSFIERVDAAGERTGYPLFSSGPLETLAAVAVAADGDLVVAGSTYHALGEATFGGQDAFVARLDPATFEARWVAQLGSDDTDWVEDLALLADGSVVVVGETLGALAPGAVLAGPSDAFAAFVAPDGAVLGAVQLGSDAFDVATRVVIDGCGSVIVGGRTGGVLVAGAPEGNGTDAFVVSVPWPSAGP